MWYLCVIFLVAEFFPGFKAESEIFYFTKDCDSLTDKDKQTVYTNFKDALDKQGVCKRHSTKVCNIAVSLQLYMFIVQAINRNK